MMVMIIITTENIINIKIKQLVMMMMMMLVVPLIQKKMRIHEKILTELGIAQIPPPRHALSDPETR